MYNVYTAEVDARLYPYSATLSSDQDSELAMKRLAGSLYQYGYNLAWRQVNDLGNEDIPVLHNLHPYPWNYSAGLYWHEPRQNRLEGGGCYHLRNVAISSALVVRADDDEVVNNRAAKDTTEIHTILCAKKISNRTTSRDWFEFSISSWYEKLANRGLCFGPAFQALDSLRTDANHNGGIKVESDTCGPFDALVLDQSFDSNQFWIQSGDHIRSLLSDTGVLVARRSDSALLALSAGPYLVAEVGTDVIVGVGQSKVVPPIRGKDVALVCQTPSQAVEAFGAALSTHLYDIGAAHVSVTPLDRIETTPISPSTLCLSLLELEHEFLATMSDVNMDRLKSLPNRVSNLLWLTGANMLGAPNPDLTLSSGLLRALGLEQPSLRLSEFIQVDVYSVSGHSVLIHAGAGALGAAAINLAKMAGATVYATCSSEAKRRYLVNQLGVPVQNIFNSRDTSFAEGIKAATGGHGVDLVVNSLVGDCMHASWDCIADFGRFIEVGKRELVDAAKLQMSTFLKDTTFTAFDLSELFYHEDPYYRDIWIAGKIKPGPITTYDVSDISSAYRAFSAKDRIGKIVVSLRNPNSLIPVAPARYRTAFDPRKIYLLVGCLGGLGMISDVGYLHENPDIEALLLRKGLQPLGEMEFLQVVDLGLSGAGGSGGSGHDNNTRSLRTAHMLTGLESQAFRKLAERGWDVTGVNMLDPRSSVLAVAEQEAGGMSSGGLSPAVIQALASESGASTLVDAILRGVRKRFSSLILMPLDQIDDSQALSQFGVDSMITAEFRTWIWTAFKVDIPFHDIMSQQKTLASLAYAINIRL
ncbi:polyketide synthase [Apiospora aurea]|uniref:Polyketide synthase n=1 Tax=Apiospora aurea TaxID=335848 RepID=A0ABR1QWC7_9PEZI